MFLCGIKIIFIFKIAYSGFKMVIFILNFKHFYYFITDFDEFLVDFEHFMELFIIFIGRLILSFVGKLLLYQFNRFYKCRCVLT